MFWIQEKKSTIKLISLKIRDQIRKQSKLKIIVQCAAFPTEKPKIKNQKSKNIKIKAEDYCPLSNISKGRIKKPKR